MLRARTVVRKSPRNWIMSSSNFSSKIFKSSWKPSLVVADWDETITLNDTIGIVAETAYIAKRNFSPSFDHFSRIYMDAYSRYLSDFKKKSGERNSIAQEELFQQGMKSVEMTSIDAITKAGLFTGLTEENFKDQASKVQIRPNFIEFVGKCKELAIPIVILSINWTSILIKETLVQHGINLDSSDIRIIVNEFEFEEDGKGHKVTSGSWRNDVSVRTAIDKLDFLKSLKASYKEILYVGDSTTDLLAMLESNVGVVMSGGSVLKVLDTLGIECTSDFISLGTNSSGTSCQRLLTGGWKDISSLLE
ncbi:HAD-like domain-containing protein [Scheffersomyces xylosifermentans]|uniref:HAD-like domain-containing protein n=1 Tax=Scheffersomyces xylosifermentans TaxID=1304137 RepID=UPI00315D06E1